MRRRNLGLVLPVDGAVPPSTLVDLARAAEVAELDTVSVGEMASTDAFAMAAALASATTRVRIDISAVAVPTRSVALLAMATTTVADLARDRFVLTLGAGSEQVSAWHNAAWNAPLRAVEERTTELRTLLAGNRVANAGRFRLIRPPGSPNAPIFLAALNPGMVRLSGRIADGVVLTFASTQVVAEFAAAAHAARVQTNEPFEVVATCFASIGEPTPQMIDEFAREVAPYAAVSTYRFVLSKLVGDETVDAIAGAWRSGGRTEAARLVPPALAAQIWISGNEASISAKVGALWEAGADTVRVIPVRSARDSVHDVLALIQLLGTLKLRSHRDSSVLAQTFTSPTGR